MTVASFSELWRADDTSAVSAHAAEAPESSAQTDSKADEQSSQDDDASDDVADEQSPNAASTKPNGQQKHVPLGELLNERKKRQEVERKAIELEATLKAHTEIYGRAAQTQQVERKSDPFAYTEDEVYTDIGAVIKKLDQKFSSTLAERERALRFAYSEDEARDRYEDFDDVIKTYPELIKSNPGIAYDVENAARPAVKAYKAIKAHREQQELRDPKALQARIDAEVTKRVTEALADRGVFEASQVPASLAGTHGEGSRPIKQRPARVPPFSQLFAKRK